MESKSQSEKHTLEWIESPKQVRVLFSGKYIANSKEVKILKETGHPPVYYFPEKDIRMDYLHATDHSTHCPFKGDANYWSVQIGDTGAENAVWSYRGPKEEAKYLAGYYAFYWDKMDAWFEEDEEIYVHPRDPYVRIDTRLSSRAIRVIHDGVMMADTNRPTLLFETGFPTRYYIPKADVRMGLLAPSDTITRCPYKGNARYYSLRIRDRIHEDLAWYYPTPLPEAFGVTNQVCFYHEKIHEFYVDERAL